MWCKCVFIKPRIESESIDTKSVVDLIKLRVKTETQHILLRDSIVFAFVNNSESSADDGAATVLKKKEKKHHRDIR